MANVQKSSGGVKGGTTKGRGGGGGGAGSSKGAGGGRSKGSGGWPSTTRQPSGKGRDNAPRTK